MTDQELSEALATMRDLMISVSTGGQRIEQVQLRFRELHWYVAAALRERRIDPAGLPDDDLWSWYGRWSGGDMKTYASRRAYVADVFRPLLAQIGQGRSRDFDPTGWERVDRTVEKARQALSRALTPEDFQGVGLLCREALISVASVVWRADRHPPTDGVTPSGTDAKRMLDAYIAVELAGNANEDVRRHARASLDLANSLQHKRAADWRGAPPCASRPRRQWSTSSRSSRGEEDLWRGTPLSA